LQRAEENLERTGLSGAVDIVAARLETWEPDGLADAILLDAPCSALGTLRRHPEGAWIKSPDDLARFPDIQARMLTKAADLLKPGGRLVYCVCTPLQREGKDVVERVLEASGLVRDPVLAGEAAAFAPSVTGKGDLLTLPGGAFAHDAFFIARLRKPGG
jgi:16S rRNA (cytosine967-C5)-methyltransferase